MTERSSEIQITTCTFALGNLTGLSIVIHSQWCPEHQEAHLLASQMSPSIIELDEWQFVEPDL